MRGCARLTAAAAIFMALLEWMSLQDTFRLLKKQDRLYAAATALRSPLPEAPDQEAARVIRRFLVRDFSLPVCPISRTL
jgi:hypothetical protein